MKYEIELVQENDKEKLRNLMQYYFYDFSEFTEDDVTENGSFGDYPYLDQYWIEDSRFPYIVRVDNKIAGFTLVRRIEEEDKKILSIAEFFVMKKYRKQGLGKKIAEYIFEKHKGNWEVFQIESNKPAQIFWTKVISEYTNGNFIDEYKKGKRVQTFNS